MKPRVLFFLAGWKLRNAFAFILAATSAISISAIFFATAAPIHTQKTSRQVTAAGRSSRVKGQEIFTPASPTPTPTSCGRIAFEFFDSSGNSAIYVMNADGSGQQQLTEAGANYNPSFSADGSKIAFESGNGIAIMDDLGGNRTQLTQGVAGDPSLNQDGSKVAFTSYTGSCCLTHDIAVIANGIETQLTATGNDSDPSFTSDGSKIAFVRGVDFGSRQIYVMNADGSNQRALTSGNLDSISPSFSGDGSKIAFRVFNDGNHSNIYVMDANGGNQQQLTFSGNKVVAFNSSPSFSADGSRIAFDDATGHISVMDANGGNLTQLATSHSVTPSFSGCPPFVIGLEVTQGVQDLNNSVPLVEHKKTFVRAHVKNPAAGLGKISTSASLTAKDTTTGNVLGTITNSNPGGQITVPRVPTRVGLNSSFLFEVPPAWRIGTVEFSFAGDGVPIGCVTGSDACSKATVTFQPVDPLSMKFVALTWSSGGDDHTPTSADIDQVKKEFIGRFPINLLDSVVGAERITVTPCDSDNFSRMLKFLNQLRNSDCGNGPCQEFYQGLLAGAEACNFSGPFVAGEANLGGHASAVFATDQSGKRIHEQGHCLGLEHTNFTGTEECENFLGISEPCTKLEGDGTLSLSKDQYAPATVYGWDVNDSSPQKIWPPETADFMSYGNPTWLSRVNYGLLFNKFVLPVAAATPEKLNQNQMSASQTVIIDGSVQLDGTAGQLGSVFVKTTPVNVTLPDPGDFSIRLEDSQGAELARYSFQPRPNSEGDFSTRAVSLLLPWDSNTKRIVLLHNEDVLDSREASANSPTVNVTFPSGGEVLTDPSATFTWISGDSDGDALTYALEYSPDNGTTWETLAIDWNAESLPVDLTKLHGSNQALIRVTACDGFNCAYAQSLGTFSVPDHAPTADISAPEDNQLYVGHQTIILEGTGSDVEDGALADSSLTWTSSLNGTLGTGSSLVIDAMTLQEGTHTITLTATDSTGHVGSASIAIRVFRTFAVSRKTHGDAGDFDVDLPLTGTPGIECRSGGATNDYTIIVTFSSAVTITGSPQAQVTSGTATVGNGGADNGGIVTAAGNVVTIPLTNVANAQTITVTLQGVNDGTSTVDLSVPISVLAGDTTANGAVNSSDVAQTQSQSGQPVTSSNFREDVTANGSINSSDVAFVQSKSGTGLPSVPSEPIRSKKTHSRSSR